MAFRMNRLMYKVVRFTSNHFNLRHDTQSPRNDGLSGVIFPLTEYYVYLKIFDEKISPKQEIGNH